MAATVDGPRSPEQLSDNEFFTAVYKKYRSLMFYTARANGVSRDVQEDIVQTSCLQLFRHIPQLRLAGEKGESALAAYISVTVRNCALDYLRRQNRHDNHVASIEDFPHFDRPSENLLPEDLLERKESAHLLTAAISRLPYEQQILLNGKYILKQSDRELATQLNCRTGSVRMKLKRARIAAKEKLNHMYPEVLP